MDMQIDVLVAAGLLALGAVLVWTLVSAWRKMIQSDKTPLFHRAMQRIGAKFGPVETEGDAHDLAQAARRCAFCGYKTECAAAMEADPGCEFLKHCPNAEFLRRAAAR